jgi:hypothetical protein
MQICGAALRRHWGMMRLMSHCSVTQVGAESGGNMKVDLLLPAAKFWMWLLFPATLERDYIGGHVTGIPLCATARGSANLNCRS